MNIQIKLLTETARLPKRATEGSAGYDLCADIKEPITIPRGEIFPVPTGVCIELPHKNLVAVVCARSGLALKQGLALCNGIGVIDSDYRGEIFFAMVNNDSEPKTVENGERIGQLMIMPVIQADYEIVSELDETERGEGGFGSTGIK